MPFARHRFPSHWATVVVLFLALAVPAWAQTPAQYVKYRVEIDAPLPLREPLRAGLDLHRWQGYETMTPELLRRLMTEAETEARDILAANGYFSPKVSATLDTGTEPQVVRLAVEPGEPTRVTGVDIRLTGAIAGDRAQEDAMLARAREDWLLPVGAVFTQVDWDRTKRRAVEIVSERLYAGARIAASEARIDPELRTATLAVTIDSGPALRFGTLRITGTARHDEARVSNLWTFAPGEPYDREKLERFQRRLVATGYFASVQVEVDPTAAEGGAVPVRVSVIEGARRRLELSLGYSTDTKFRGGADWRNNDLFARDWRLRLNANLETVQQSAEAAVDLPERPSGWADTVGVRWRITDIENLETDEWRIGLRTAAVDERSRPAFGAAYIASRQTPSGFPPEDVYATFLDYVHTWRTTDNLLSPRRGLVVQSELGGGVPGVSTKGFGRVIGRLAWFVPFGTANELSFRAEAGAVLASSRDGIPESLLFRTGGATTVRGYNFESLGVTRGEAVVGGRYLAIVSGEYTRWIWDGIGLAAFIDAGNAADEISGFRFALGYGVGVRAQSPIGPFRLDVAYGEEDGKVRLHFSVGLTF
ncbi:MAG: autotransporter assembly complex protein TamA [Bacteroidota bacterium]